MIIAERLLQLRQEHGLTLRELSEQVGITAAALSAYEKGKKEPSLEFAIKLAKHYGKTLDYLCGIESVTQSQTYADVLMFILKMAGTLEAKTSSARNYVIMDGVAQADSRMIDFKMESNSSGARINISISSKDIGTFFDTYFKLASLVQTEMIPRSVFSDWKKDALAKEAKILISPSSEKTPPVKGEQEEV